VLEYMSFEHLAYTYSVCVNTLCGVQVTCLSNFSFFMFFLHAVVSSEWITIVRG